MTRDQLQEEVKLRAQQNIDRFLCKLRQYDPKTRRDNGVGDSRPPKVYRMPNFRDNNYTRLI